MDEQHQSDDPKDKKESVQNSIKKLKEKFVPGVKYTLLISAIFNFIMLVIGCLNVHKCPVNKHIPLFLIATGAIGLTSKFVSYVRGRISQHMQVVYLESALYSVETIFFALGTYWVYNEFQPSYNRNDGDKYCNKTAYIFAFTYLTIYYTLLLTILFGFCCFICCAFILLLRSTSFSGDPEAPIENTETTEPVSPTTQIKVEVEAKS